ncbi:MAG: hypothetical protein F4148_07095, partial [Caldilineaceae bacterium SB0675_bin_29]|nr:hypothetical protein [Caldilineaceae bacterium SB0675_bin_29]
MGTGTPANKSEERAKRKPPLPFLAPVHSLLAGWTGLALWLLLMLLLALYPYTGVSSVSLFVGSQIFVLVTLASNWNLIGGMT